MNVAVFNTREFEKPLLREFNNDKHDLHLLEEPLNAETVDRLPDCEAVVSFPSDEIDAGVLDELSDRGVRYVATRSAGYDHIDLEHARELGIKVANAPDYSPHAVAEHAIGMMLTLNRKFIDAHKKIQRENFETEGLVGFELHGKTVGVLGTGNIGEAITKILHGFGCRLLLWDQVKKEELEQKYDARYVDLDTLCAESRIITIHLPLNDATHYLIDADKFAKMRRGVMLINTGRGAIIKTDDLIEALKSGQVGSAGLDVYEYEKGLFYEDRSGEPLRDEQFAYLEANSDVLVTAHQAYATQTALRNMIGTTFRNLNRWAAGKTVENER